MRVVVAGAGVIGAAVAYFARLKGLEVVVVEAAGVAAAASGKSGGFLALDWCDGTPLAALARRSFALHDELARRLPDDWGYRRLDTLAIAASAGRSLPGSRAGLPGWLGPAARLSGRLGSPSTTAQVDPAGFTRALIDAARRHGARLETGRVTGIDLGPTGERVQAVAIDGQPLAADAVVIAMGPWSVTAAAWLPLPPVLGLMGHSLILESPAGITPHALFVDCEADDGSVDTPEVFPRPDGTTYVCGLAAQAPLPADPLSITSDGSARDRLLAMVRTFAPPLAGARIVASQACYRPVTQDGLPLIGALPGVQGAFVATGHSVWGMLNGPATGEALAALIAEGRSSLDLAPFDPGRMAPIPRPAPRSQWWTRDPAVALTGRCRYAKNFRRFVQFL